MRQRATAAGPLSVWTNSLWLRCSEFTAEDGAIDARGFSIARGAALRPLHELFALFGREGPCSGRWHDASGDARCDSAAARMETLVGVEVVFRGFARGVVAGAAAFVDDGSYGLGVASDACAIDRFLGGRQRVMLCTPPNKNQGGRKECESRHVAALVPELSVTDGEEVVTGAGTGAAARSGCSVIARALRSRAGSMTLR